MSDGIKMIGQEWNPFLQKYIKHFVVDSKDCIENLPECAVTSDAIVVDGGSMYMVNTLGEWKKFRE